EKSRLEALSELEDKLPELAIDGRVPWAVAERVIRASYWWLDHWIRPVLIKNCTRIIRGSESDWFIQRETKQFRLTVAIDRCRKSLRSFIHSMRSGKKISQEDFVEDLRLKIQSAIFNSLGHEWKHYYKLGKPTKYYRGLDVSRHMVLDTHSIDT